MDIDALTIGEAKTLANMFAAERLSCAAIRGPWNVGETYLIRTVTMTLTGKLLSVSAQELELVDAAWIADTGRYANAIKSCDFNEVEPYPDGQPVIVGRGSVIDATVIATLPRKLK